MVRCVAVCGIFGCIWKHFSSWMPKTWFGACFCLATRTHFEENSYLPTIKYCSSIHTSRNHGPMVFLTWWHHELWCHQVQVHPNPCSSLFITANGTRSIQTSWMTPTVTQFCPISSSQLAIEELKNGHTTRILITITRISNHGERGNRTNSVMPNIRMEIVLV